MKTLIIQYGNISINAYKVVEMSKDAFIEAGKYYRGMPADKQKIKLGMLYDECTSAVGGQMADAPAAPTAPSPVDAPPPVETLTTAKGKKRTEESTL